MTCGPTSHSTAKEAAQRTLYRRSPHEFVWRDLNHAIAEEYETRECIWTAAAGSYKRVKGRSHPVENRPNMHPTAAARFDAELDRGDGICVAIFVPFEKFLPGQKNSGGSVASTGGTHVSYVQLSVGGFKMVPPLGSRTRFSAFVKVLPVYG